MSESVIVWNTRDPLGGLSPEEFEAELRRLLAGRALAAYTFGSYGSKEFGRDSDVDLIVVAETSRPFVERPLDYSDLMDLVPDMDLLVYTSEEFAKLTNEPSAGFWTSVVESLRRIA